MLGQRSPTFRQTWCGETFKGNNTCWDYWWIQFLLWIFFFWSGPRRCRDLNLNLFLLFLWSYSKISCIQIAFFDRTSINRPVNLEPLVHSFLSLEGAVIRVRALSMVGVTNLSDFCETVHLTLHLVSLFVLTGAQCNKGWSYIFSEFLIWGGRGGAIQTLTVESCVQ